MKVRLMHPAIGELAFPLKSGASLVVGRIGAMTDVEISWDPRISRRHCRLWEQNGRVWFEDLGSRNGSWVAGERVERAVCLNEGASVLIGETVLLLPDEQAGEIRHLQVRETHERLPNPDEVRARAAAQATLGLADETHPSRDGTAVYESPTIDLRHAGEVGTPSRSSAGRAGEEPHFAATDLVLFQARSREEVRELWERDLSKGGLFVPTRNPPERGAVLEVRVETPAGALNLRGTVVHVLSEEAAASFGGRAGVGIQVSDISLPLREAIDRYLQGVADQFEETAAHPTEALAPEACDEALRRARSLLRDAEQRDFYAAVGVHPTAPMDSIRSGVTRMENQLQEALAGVPPPKAARVQAALNLLGRIRRVLTHVHGRLEYDFRNDHIRAQERLAAARTGAGPSLTELREAWNRVFPERVDRAALLTRRAFAARQRQDFRGALDAGHEAMALNPFFEELRHTLGIWEATAERHR